MIRLHHSLPITALLLVVLLSGNAFAQDGPNLSAPTVHFSDDSTLLNLSDIPWRFHPGDDAAWADPAFDDGEWQLVNPDFSGDTMRAIGWEGIGWFRLRIKTDSAFTGQSVVITLVHTGASEFYINGDYLHRVGRPAQHSNQRPVPDMLRLD